VRVLWALAIGAVLSAASGVVARGRVDLEAGKEVAKRVCAACHGVDGISLVRDYPNLAGQKELYLIAQLEAFRSGERKSPLLMNPVASILTDDEIKNLAAYYSRLK
jgi:cytochrome c553